MKVDAVVSQMRDRLSCSLTSSWGLLALKALATGFLTSACRPWVSWPCNLGRGPRHPTLFGSNEKTNIRSLLASLRGCACRPGCQSFNPCCWRMLTWLIWHPAKAMPSGPCPTRSCFSQSMRPSSCRGQGPLIFQIFILCQLCHNRRRGSICTAYS